MDKVAATSQRSNATPARAATAATLVEAQDAHAIRPFVHNAYQAQSRKRFMTHALATFAAGCFWGVEETFRTTPGVISTRVGYTGGDTRLPTYADVCSGETGHAEAVEVTYDPKKISYEELLTIFFENHNPCEVDRQGPDVGTQYRSAVFYHDTHQQASAQTMKETLDATGTYKRPIATQLLPVGTFYPAEEYHQQYLLKRGKSSCHF